jgi:hypothetical protein
MYQGADGRRRRWSQHVEGMVGIDGDRTGEPFGILAVLDRQLRLDTQPSLPHADSTAASAHLPGHTRHTRVGLWYVSPNVSLALDQGGRRGGQEGCKEVEQDAVLVGQTEDAGDET